VNDEGNALAFGKRGPYNPANRETRVCGSAFQSKCMLCVIPGAVFFEWNPFFELGALPGSKTFQSRIGMQERSRRKAVAAASIEEHVFLVEQISHRFKEPC
jgi:hypothetical protein